MLKPKRPMPKGKVRSDFYLKKGNKKFLIKTANSLDVSESRALDLILERARKMELLSLV